MKEVFFELIDDQAQKLIAKKVAKMNGDLRVAFDILKTCFVNLQASISDPTLLPLD
jgi:hypothetical protein